MPASGAKPPAQPPVWLEAEADQLRAACAAHDGDAAVGVVDRIAERDPRLAAAVTGYLLDAGLPRLVDQLVDDALDHADTDDADTDDADSDGDADGAG
jgi:hypothetical protein